MKTKIILAAFICLLGFQTANADIKKSTDDWTKKSNTPTLRDIGGNTPTGDPDVSPIGDALWIVGLLAGGYMLVRKKTRRA
jgi:hypothetical protein